MASAAHSSGSKPQIAEAEGGLIGELKKEQRVCAHCWSPLPQQPGAGGQALCRCDRCEAEVKPSYLSPEDRARKFRDDLRVLVRVEIKPAEIAAELLAGLEQRIWTNLRNASNQPFADFDDFCRQPSGLNAEPAVVRGLIKKLHGRNALKLITVPATRQGRRTDLDPTCRPQDEKSKTPATDTRCRTIQSGPPAARLAFWRAHLPEKEAARLATHAAQNPECPLLKSILKDLERIPANEKPVPVLKGIRARIQALPLARGATKKAPHEASCASEVAATGASTSRDLTAANSTAPRSHGAGVDGPVGVDAAGPAAGANGSTTELELALLRFLDGGRAMDRLGFAEVDSAALVRILGEARGAPRLPDTRRLAEELLLLQEVAQLANVLGTTFDHYADLRKIAMRETLPVPAIIQAARDEVARRLNSTNAVKKACLPRGAKTRNVA